MDIVLFGNLLSHLLNACLYQNKFFGDAFQEFHNICILGLDQGLTMDELPEMDETPTPQDFKHLINLRLKEKQASGDDVLVSNELDTESANRKGRCCSVFEWTGNDQC